MNRTLLKLTTLPARIPATASKAAARVAALALPAMLLASEAFAQAAGNTLGSRMQAASTDLTTGGGYVLQILGYLLGGTALALAGPVGPWHRTLACCTDRAAVRRRWVTWWIASCNPGCPFCPSS